ncbi:MAG: hypothetical protein Q8T11_00155 [Elusimicrobiota bacterium]|nr:hypothetical protein [Elusimicrobiota bacterium]
MTEITVKFNLSFSRRFITAAGAFAIMLCAVPELDSESVTLSTYYPAPSGVYTNMITTNNTFLARDGGALAVGTVTPVGGSKVTVAGGSIAGTYGLTPSYVAWNTYGTGAGGAAIYNDSGAYQGLMLVGNNSGGGGVRRVKVWDEMTVNGNTITTGNASVSGAISTSQKLSFTEAIVNTSYNCIAQVYGIGVQNCPAGRFATYTSGVMVKYTMTVGTTDPGGTMLCCDCPTGGCPSL